MPVHLKRFYDRHQCLKMGQLIAAVLAGWSSRVGETPRRGGTRATPRRGAHPRSWDLNYIKLLYIVFVCFCVDLKRMLNGAVVLTSVYRRWDQASADKVMKAMTSTFQLHEPMIFTSWSLSFLSLFWCCYILKRQGQRSENCRSDWALWTSPKMMPLSANL